MRIVRSVAAATPGASDALAERLAAAPEGIDHVAAIRELIAELSRLLVDPLVLVVDDAEHLDGAAVPLRLLGELIRAEVALLHVAVASRRPLEVRVAKPRAAGRLTELGASDLALDTEECAALLRARGASNPSPEWVEEVMRATQGWPLGVALAAGVGEGPARTADPDTALGSLRSIPDLRSYFSEELLDSLQPELRQAAITAAVPIVVTPEVAAALELGEDPGARLERAGLLVRHPGDDPRTFGYHPLLREFLLERLHEERADRERRRLNARVASAIADSQPIEAVEHWLAAEEWAAAVAVIESLGPGMLRTAPILMANWLSRLPPDVRRLPTIRLFQGQLEWGAGQHERAVPHLREAVAGHRRAQDAEREWLSRFFLAEALFSAGPFEELLELAEGWETPGTPRAKVAAAGVAWYTVLALTALGRGEEADRLAAQLRRDPKTAARFSYLADLASLMVDLAAGGAETALVPLHATIRDLELHDPQGRLAVLLSIIGLVHLDIGEVAMAMESFERCQQESERLGLGFVARDAHLQRATLLAEQGELDAAELELRRAGTHEGTGWRGVSRHTAAAEVASARGDAQEAIAEAQRALVRVRAGLVCYRVWAAIAMAIVLAKSGSPDLAGSAVDDALSVLDQHFPAERGRYHRARLIATRAWLEHEAGRREAAARALKRCWEEAGDRAHLLARAHWRTLRPILWDALAEGELDPDSVLPALDRAFPRGEALITFTDHPHAAVRAAALSAALVSNHPTVLSRLQELVDDPDDQLASTAVATRERLRRSPPPIRFALLGGFRVVRAGWPIDSSAWGRPADARLVRFLLAHPGQPVPEDLIFEALWPGKAQGSARRSLQVAVSRVRGVVDLPGTQTSVIESGDRAYRLALRARDSLDADEFQAAADLALGAQCADRGASLKRARSLWGGEPLPEERYSDWATAYRESLVDRYIAVLTALVELCARAGEHDAAAALARELVDLDSLNEGGHRALITAYARAGRTGHALRQYLECRRALIGELGIEPAEETSRLQALILAGEPV